MYNVSFPGLGIENLQIDPVAISIGDFKITWYGILIAVGMILGVFYALHNAKRYNISKDHLIDCVLAGVVLAIIGARLYYVAFEWETYSKDIWSIFRINEGGLAIYGGLIGGLLGAVIVAKIRKVNIKGLLDLAVIGFFIGQGIGRWGNFMNQEAFGVATDLPWGMVSENTNNIAVHPCFLYESISCLIGALVLHIFAKKMQKYDGQIFLLYLVWYGIERAIVEGLRTDSLYTPIFDLRVSQVLSIVLALAGITLLIINFIKKNDKMAVPLKKIESFESKE